MKEFEFTEKVYNMLCSEDKEMRTLAINYFREMTPYFIIGGLKIHLRCPSTTMQYHFTHYKNVYEDTIIRKTPSKHFFI